MCNCCSVLIWEVGWGGWEVDALYVIDWQNSSGGEYEELGWVGGGEGGNMEAGWINDGC